MVLRAFPALRRVAKYIPLGRLDILHFPSVRVATEVLIVDSNVDYKDSDL